MVTSAEVSAFLEDLSENLAIIENATLGLEENPDQQDYWHEIFRAAHTIKGNAAMMHLKNLVAVGHALETALQEILSGHIRVSAHSIGLLHDCRRAMQEIADALKAKKDPSQIAIRQVTDQIQILLLSAQDSHASQTERKVRVTLNIANAEQVPSVRAFLVETKLAELGKILEREPSDEVLDSPQFAISERQLTFVLQSQAELDEFRENLNIDLIENLEIQEISQGSTVTKDFHSSKQAEENQKSAPVAAQDFSAIPTDTIRLSVNTLDQLLNLTGELVIANGTLVSLSEQAANQVGVEFARPILEKSREIFRIAAELQNVVMKSRMLPLEHVFSRFRRFVRDYAEKSGKAIRFEVSGAETELDKRVIDEMVKPLTHLIRNALDHGIEERAERLAAGKSANGTLKLSAAQSGNSILIVVEDDGRGLNAERILEKAVSRNLVSPERAASLTIPEIYEFIFVPGFSTKESADEISGRGFGMDIVRDSIRKLSGDLQLFSERGKGTRMVVKLPLTLAILTALTVRVRNDLFAIPLAVIEESIQLPAGGVLRLDDREIIKWREQLLPYVRLDDALGYPPVEDERSHHYAIIVSVHRMRFAIGVDEFLRKQELVVKSLSEHYRHVPMLSGASMLGDNEIVFILDVEEIMRLQAENLAYHRTTSLPAQIYQQEEKASPVLAELPRDEDEQRPLPDNVEYSNSTKEKPMTPIFDFSNKELLRKWIAQSNKTAVNGIQMLTGNQSISVKKSRGARVKAEKSREMMERLTTRADNIWLIHLPMLPKAGAIDLILEKEAAKRMASLLFKAAGFASVEEFDPSPLLEITNILGSAYTNTLTFLTNTAVEPATPTLLSSRTEIENLLNDRMQSAKSEMLLVENQFHIDEEDIAVELMIYLQG